MSVKLAFLATLEAKEGKGGELGAMTCAVCWWRHGRQQTVFDLLPSG
jgi:hypothetical protein